jgi:nitroreductase
MNTFKKYLVFVLLTPLLFGCKGTTNTADDDTSALPSEQILTMLTETRTTQYFSDESVPEEDINKILNAGRNAVSGRNMQPWYFGAIINQEVIKEIASTMRMGPPPGAPGIPPPGAPSANAGAPMPPPAPSAYPKAGFADAPAAIAVACDPNNTFSAGLACENMFVAATALGYGAKIVAGGTDHLNNEDNRALLNIPDDMNVVAILIVGKRDTTIDMTADGVTGASTRKPLNEISTVIK